MGGGHSPWYVTCKVTHLLNCFVSVFLVQKVILNYVLVGPLCFLEERESTLKVRDEAKQNQ